MEDGLETNPAEFLTKLGNDLAKRTDLDTDLVEVLKTHLLKEAPASDAVNLAKAAILDIAKKRCAKGEGGGD